MASSLRPVVRSRMPVHRPPVHLHSPRDGYCRCRLNSRDQLKHDGPVCHQTSNEPSASVLASTRQNFARVEDVVGIKGGLDLAHDGKATAVFGLEVFALALPDAVLASAGALHANGPLG